MKKSPIENHKEKDVQLLRKVMLGIINDDEATKKDRTEAAKLLARMHHALQVDRTTVKATAKTDALPKKTKEDLNDRVNQLLGHLEGSGSNQGAVS